MAAAASMECRATRRFSAEKSGRMCDETLMRISAYYDWLRSRVKSRNSKRVGLPRAVRKPDTLHQSLHLRWSWKVPYRCRQIAIRPAISANHAAYGRQHAPKIDCVSLAHQTARLAEIQNSQLAARLQPSMKFTQPRLVVGQLAKPERGHYQIE